ncbi:protein rft1 homolog, partial [Plakobranchus ocellatus]
FGLRITTFVLNGFILRYVAQETLGIVNVRLTLLYSTTLFLAKEAFERACLSKIVDREWRQVINLLWCTFPLAVFCSSVLGCVWLYVLGISVSSTTSLSSYTFGVFSFALSTVIEVLAEPVYVIGQAFLFVKLKKALKPSESSYLICTRTLAKADCIHHSQEICSSQPSSPHTNTHITHNMTSITTAPP